MLEESNTQRDEQFGRRLACWALGVSDSNQTSILAEMQTRMAKGDMKLKTCREERISHAVATPPAKFSVVLITDEDLARGRIARIIHRLPAPFPDAIKWRSHPDADVRMLAGRHLAFHVAEQFETRHPTVHRKAARMAQTMVKPGGVAKPYELDWLWMPYGVWRDSGERKLWGEVHRMLSDLEVQGLDQMVTEAVKNDLT